MAELIWNGVGITTPDSWEPAAIERDGLVLQYEDLPVCELKWNEIQGSFSFDKHIKRLTKGNKDAALSGVDETDTPQAWNAAIDSLAESGIRTKSFIWKTDVSRGIGAALHNPATGLAALVQFFIYKEEDETRAADALASFRDYTGGKTRPWAMFGLRARIPAEFKLNTFSFKPGHYTVKYWRPGKAKHTGKIPPGKGPGTHLVFERFAPASVLLKETSLSDWTRASLEDAPPAFVDMTEQGNSTDWSGFAKTSLVRQFLRRSIHTQGRVWTTESGNAILSVIAHGTVFAPEPIFNDICENYEFV